MFKGKSVSQSLVISLHIFSTYQSKTVLLVKDGLEDIMTKMNKEYGLIDLVIKDFEKYK